MAAAPNSPEKERVTETLTLLWAANESFAGAFLHALNIPFKGIYLTGFSLFMLQMIAEASFAKIKLLSAGIKVSAVKAVINPFASINSHLAVFFQSATGSIFLQSGTTTKVRIYLLSFSAMIFTAFQRLFLVWLFYGMVLYDAVNLFLSKLVSEFEFLNLKTYDYSLLLISVYLTAHLAAGVFCGRFIHKFIQSKPKWDENYNLSEKFLTFTEGKAAKTNSRGIKFSWILPICVLLFIALGSYTISPDNFPFLLMQIAARYILALILLFLLRTLYVSFMRNRSENNPAISEPIADVKKMRVYFSFAYQETKSIPLLKKPEMFFKVLLQISKFHTPA